MFNINELFSKRINKKNNISIINKIKKIKRDALNRKEKIIDLTNINENIQEDNIAVIDKSCAGYFKVENNIDVDCKYEMYKCKNNKELIDYLSMIFIDSDDYIITTSPDNGYFDNIVKMYDCKVYEYKLNKFNNYLIDFDDIEENILKKCKFLYLNYPNDITGSVANKEFYRQVVKYAKKYNFIVINDASYLNLTFDNKDKISLFNVEGSKDIGIEIYDFSKSLSLKKLDMCISIGNRHIINVLKTIREDNYTSEDFINVLNDYEKINNNLKEKYLNRHKLMKEVFEKQGFKNEIPKAGIYQCFNIPKSCNGVEFEDNEEFCYWLFKNTNIMILPINKGEKTIAASVELLVNDENGEKELFRKIEEELNKYNFEF